MYTVLETYGDLSNADHREVISAALKWHWQASQTMNIGRHISQPLLLYSQTCKLTFGSGSSRVFF